MSVYEVALPAGLPLLNANHRVHHHKRARLTRDLREAALIASLAARVPRMEAVEVLAYIHPARRGRSDPANLYPAVKAAVDGALVDAGVVADDDHTHLSGPHMLPAEPVRGGQLRLVVTERRACACGHDRLEHLAGSGCWRPGCGCGGWRVVPGVPAPVRVPVPGWCGCGHPGGVHVGGACVRPACGCAQVH